MPLSTSAPAASMVQSSSPWAAGPASPKRSMALQHPRCMTRCRLASVPFTIRSPLPGTLRTR